MKDKIMEYITTDVKLQGGLIGVSIRSKSTGKVLFEHQDDIRMHPASNMKLLTSAAALSVLGENYTFQTDIRTAGNIDDNTLHGDLYIIGKGDPTLLPEVFDTLAQALRKRGLTKIEGNVVGDDSWYDDTRLSPDLVWTDEQYYYGAQVSALTASPNEDYDTGSIIIEASASRPLEKPTIALFPSTDYITILNNAITVTEKIEDELIIERKHASNVIEIKGKISIDSEKIKEFMAVWEPTTYALHLFAASLEREGITWNGKVKVGKAKENSQLLLSRKSIPLSELLVPFMKFSNNGHAEILVKEMGKVVYGEGSWEKGLEVMKGELANLGMNMDTIVMKDGSGISHSNAIPANEITKLLHDVQSKSWFHSYLKALPVAGEEERIMGGTLQDRMKGIKVSAKTGTIEGVSTLSGYMETKKGSEFIFSIMLNHLLDEEEGKTIENELVEIIANEG
ncbi:D-alanyl-D-alanine carboxypeptidase/D-alanyl-D-alanine-endopeptidase [Oceanobacillus bengalensis]|nr:D-alanyl-D-alanine carboxypeptidase/D-alanyl-D-alanine-endopeptidase [Oceanobacillus bengalensis]